MLKREKQPMPDFVRDAIVSKGLMEDYQSRPDYQQNDYLAWIKQAKLESTKQKRLRQMLEELEYGGVYMSMDHPPSKKQL